MANEAITPAKNMIGQLASYFRKGGYMTVTSENEGKLEVSTPEIKYTIRIDASWVGWTDSQ